mmetsp:Transcript_9819/g.31097  ORF Transcript_9819/g.31097 Transcript_9819/m.31097 type:complete len:250 (+) Transcript_9819:361-1110(+)
MAMISCAAYTLVGQMLRSRCPLSSAASPNWLSHALQSPDSETYEVIASSSSLILLDCVATGTISWTSSVSLPERDRLVSAMFLTELLLTTIASPLAVRKCVRITSMSLTMSEYRTGSWPGVATYTRSPMSYGRVTYVKKKLLNTSATRPPASEKKTSSAEVSGMSMLTRLIRMKGSRSSSTRKMKATRTCRPRSRIFCSRSKLSTEAVSSRCSLYERSTTLQNWSLSTSCPYGKRSAASFGGGGLRSPW